MMAKKWSENKKQQQQQRFVAPIPYLIQSKFKRRAKKIYHHATNNSCITAKHPLHLSLIASAAFCVACNLGNCTHLLLAFYSLLGRNRSHCNVERPTNGHCTSRGRRWDICDFCRWTKH